jgi:hypothetical protein
MLGVMDPTSPRERAIFDRLLLGFEDSCQVVDHRTGSAQLGFADFAPNTPSQIVESGCWGAILVAPADSVFVHL